MAPSAELDLDQIERTISTDSPRRAVSFLRELRTKIAGLAFSAGLHGHHPEVGPPLKRIGHWPYLIFYDLDEQSETVNVIAVMYGGRDLPAVLADRLSERK